MNQKRVLKGILTALICLTAIISASAEDTQAPQVIDFAGGIETIDKLDLNTDPTLKSSMTTDWEVALDSPADANENGHALLFHDGKLYVYMNKYVQGGKSEHVMRAYNASDGNIIEEKVIPFSSISEIWVGNSILSHTIAVDDEGRFLFVFGNQNDTPSLTLVTYSFETNIADVFRTVKVSNESLKYNLNASSLSLSDAVINGNTGADFTLSVNIFVKQIDANHQDIRSVPLTIKCENNIVTALREKQNTTLQEYHNYVSDLPEYNIGSICEIDENHILASHNPAAFKPTNNIDRFSLFCDSNSGYYNLKENWADENLMPAIGDYCLGMYVVKHDGHNVLVYAKSYVDNCLYNVVLWDDPSSFANMKLLGQIKVQGKISVSNIYKEGIRQMVVQEPKAVAPSEPSSAPRTYPTKDYYEHTTFYTYAPGAALARHSIVTEEDKIYTALTEISAESPLRLDGKTLHGCEYSPIAIHTPSGSLVAEYPAAATIDLSLLPSGIYIIKSGKSTIKAAL